MGSDALDSVAYTVKGVGITARQRDAGLASMVGTFSKNTVAKALCRAGVAYSVPGEPWLADSAADRLLQSERARGNIRAITNRTWECVSK